MKVSAILTLSFVSLSAAAVVKSTPIEQTLQELEHDANEWRSVAASGVPADAIVGPAADQVKTAIQEIRKAVEESAKAVCAADIKTKMDEKALLTAKGNLNVATQILNNGTCTF